MACMTYRFAWGLSVITGSAERKSVITIIVPMQAPYSVISSAKLNR